MKYKFFLDTLDIADALWWFIENVNEDDPHRTEYFFYLRERYRNESDTQRSKVNKVCSVCGSDDVRIDAWAAWNVETQEWGLAETFQQEFCNACGGETHINNEELES